MRGLGFRRLAGLPPPSRASGACSARSLLQSTARGLGSPGRHHGLERWPPVLGRRGADGTGSGRRVDWPRGPASLDHAGENRRCARREEGDDASRARAPRVPPPQFIWGSVYLSRRRSTKRPHKSGLPSSRRRSAALRPDTCNKGPSLGSRRWRASSAKAAPSPAADVTALCPALGRSDQRGQQILPQGLGEMGSHGSSVRRG